MPVNINETVVLRVAFRDASGSLVDPSTPVEITIKQPDGTEDGPHTATKTLRGVFEYEYTPTQQEEHKWYAESADGFIEAGRPFLVRSPYEHDAETHAVAGPVGFGHLEEAEGANDPLYTDELVTVTTTPDQDLSGDMVRAYAIDKDGNRTQYGSDVSGTNETEIGIEARPTDEGLSGGYHIIQFVYERNATEHTFDEQTYLFTEPAS